MSTVLADLLGKLKYEKGLTIKGVAESIGYTREHLNKLKPKGDPDIEKMIMEKYGISHNVKKDNLSQTLDIISSLTENNRMLAEANLILAKKISSGETGSASSLSQEEETNKRLAVHQGEPLGKLETRSNEKKAKRKGTVSETGK